MIHNVKTLCFYLNNCLLDFILDVKNDQSLMER